MPAVNDLELTALWLWKAENHEIPKMWLDSCELTSLRRSDHLPKLVKTRALLERCDKVTRVKNTSAKLDKRQWSNWKYTWMNTDKSLNELKFIWHDVWHQSLSIVHHFIYIAQETHFPSIILWRRCALFYKWLDFVLPDSCSICTTCWGGTPAQELAEVLILMGQMSVAFEGSYVWANYDSDSVVKRVVRN